MTEGTVIIPVERFIAEGNKHKFRVPELQDVMMMEFCAIVNRLSVQKESFLRKHEKIVICGIINDPGMMGFYTGVVYDDVVIRFSSDGKLLTRPDRKALTSVRSAQTYQPAGQQMLLYWLRIINHIAIIYVLRIQLHRFQCQIRHLRKTIRQFSQTLRYPQRFSGDIFLSGAVRTISQGPVIKMTIAAFNNFHRLPLSQGL